VDISTRRLADEDCLQTTVVFFVSLLIAWYSRTGCLTGDFLLGVMMFLIHAPRLAIRRPSRDVRANPLIVRFQSIGSSLPILNRLAISSRQARRGAQK